MIVLLDRICNLSACVGGELSNAQAFRHTHTSFQSPRLCFNSCSFLALNNAWWKKCHFSVIHPHLHVVGTSQPVLLFKPLQWCSRIRCCIVCFHGFGCDCRCLSHVQHVHLFVFMHQCCLLVSFNYTRTTCQQIPKFIYNGSRDVLVATTWAHKRASNSPACPGTCPNERNGGPQWHGWGAQAAPSSSNIDQWSCLWAG